jgi:HAMP domain-containing protein
MRLSLKLGALCATVAMVPLLVASLIVVLQVSASARNEMLGQLRGSARAASGLYEKRTIELSYAAEQLSGMIAARGLVGNEAPDKPDDNAGWAQLHNLLSDAKNTYFLDFVIVADAQGRVRARHSGRPAPGETVTGGEDKNPLVEKVINGGSRAVASCAIERGERYRRLWLDRMARVELADGSTVDEALMVEAAAPIVSGGRPVGAVLIGQILNNLWNPRTGASSIQTPLIAEIRQTLARSASEDSGAIVANNRGVIASSIPPATAGREVSGDPVLLGALHDPTSSEETLSRDGRSYVAAWQPLKDFNGNVIGSLGVARPAAELTNAGESVRATLLLIGLIATVLAGAGGFVVGRIIGGRVDDLREAASRWTVGELSTPAREHAMLDSNGFRGLLRKDEITILAGQMEQMRLSIRNAIERLRRR